MAVHRHTQYHCPCCAARWKWGTGRQERWVLLHNGEEAEPDYYVWGNNHTQVINQFCEDVTSWMKAVKLASVVQDACKGNKGAPSDWSNRPSN
eukprot:4047032-Amphidinium_carterae.1